MKWFKHHTKMHEDRAVEKLISEFGLAGYGLYCYCLEIIAGSVEVGNITFELEPDAEILARRLSMDTLLVERIIKKCIEYDLFTLSADGRIQCFKMLKFIEQDMTGQGSLRTAIKTLKGVRKGENDDRRMTDGWQLDGSRMTRVEERRVEERRGESVQYSAQKSPIQPESIGAYPAAILKAWTSLGDRVIQPASEIAWLNTYSRDVSPYTKGIHSDDVLAAIDNFGTILGKPETYWQGKVTAGAWFSRHLEKFLPRNFNARDFRKWDADGEPEEDFETRMTRIRGKGATA